MKFKLFLILLFCCSLNKSLNANEISNFTSKLNSIVNSFVANIMDEYECTKNAKDAEELGSDIKEYLEDEFDDLTLNDKRTLIMLQKQAEALEVYIHLCNNSGNGIPTIEEFQIVNDLVNADVAYLYKDKFCADFFQIRIKDFMCLVVVNNKTTGCNIKFNWKVPSSGISGRVDSGFPEQSIRSFNNNQTYKINGNIVIENVICKSF